jgi:hypothetical protein
MWPLAIFLILAMVVLFVIAVTIWSSVGNAYADRLEKMVSRDHRLRRLRSSLSIQRITGAFGARGPIPILPNTAFEVVEVLTGETPLAKTRHLRFAWSGQLLRALDGAPRRIREAFGLKCKATRSLLLIEAGLLLIMIATFLMTTFFILQANR